MISINPIKSLIILDICFLCFDCHLPFNWPD